MSNPHPLDRPIWSALSGRLAQFALVQGAARRMAVDIGIFADVEDLSEDSRADLAKLVAETGEVGLVGTQAPPPIAGTRVTLQDQCWQMVAHDFAAASPEEVGFVELGEADAPQMLALASLTKPGPYFARTHVLGDFIGVKAGGRLVAMAGERLRVEGMTEVSGVCTHPEARGRGYAAALTAIVAGRIRARGETPFLHVFAHNKPAIAIYEQLGFRLRCEMQLTGLAAA
ncbi:MAG TPA: GNAT family N-acetyltransferase [Phenylobacterium sp.]